MEECGLSLWSRNPRSHLFQKRHSHNTACLPEYTEELNTRKLQTQTAYRLSWNDAAITLKQRWAMFVLSRAAYVTVSKTAKELMKLRRVSTTILTFFLSFFWRNSPQWVKASSFTRFINHTQQRTTVGRTPLDEWLARCRQTSMARWDSNLKSRQANGRRTWP